MDFTSQDIAIIEQALRAAISHEPSVMKQSDYREVLTKLRNNSIHALTIDGGDSFPDLGEYGYDYDDSADRA